MRRLLPTAVEETAVLQELPRVSAGGLLRSGKGAHGLDGPAHQRAVNPGAVHDRAQVIIVANGPSAAVACGDGAPAIRMSRGAPGRKEKPPSLRPTKTRVALGVHALHPKTGRTPRPG